MKRAVPTEGTLLLCLDLQPVFLSAVAHGPRVLERCRFAVSAAQGLGLRTAFTEQVPAKLGRTDPSLLGLLEEPEVHAKQSFSALAEGTEVRAKLTEGRGLEHVLLCGVETPICVYQTALDALKSGLSVTLVSDCIGARREDDSAHCLAALARAGAHILPSETIFYSLLGDTAHPFFRAYTQLVKKYG